LARLDEEDIELLIRSLQQSPALTKPAIKIHSFAIGFNSTYMAWPEGLPAANLKSIQADHVV